MLVTHDLDQAARLADWVVRLDEGWSPGRPGPGRGSCCAGDRRAARPSTSALGEVAATLVLVAVAVAVSLLAARRARAGHRHRGAALLPPADRDRLRDQRDLRAGQPVVRVRADRRDGRVRRLHGPRPRAIGPGLVRAAPGGARALRPATTLGAGGACSGCSTPSRASWCRSGGMVVGNAMTAAAVSLNRLGDEVRSGAGADRGDAGARRHGDRRRCSRRCAAACARG